MDTLSRIIQLSSYQPMINKSAEKTVQAVKVRSKLVDEKIRGIEKLRSANADERNEGKFILNRCLKNEINFIEIMDFCLKEQVDFLNKLEEALKENKADRKTLEHITYLIDITKSSYNRLEKINSRIKKEEKILRAENGAQIIDPKYDSEFFDMWREELDEDKRLFKKISRSKLKDIQSFSSTVISLSKKVMGGAATGTVAIPLAGMFGIVYTSAMLGEDKIKQITLAVMAMGAIIGVIVGVELFIEENEKLLFEHQLQAIKKLDKRKGFFQFWH